MDKNKAVYDWIKECPAFEKLYFNFGTAEANTSTFIPVPVDRVIKKDIFDTETRRYDFAVSSFGFVDDGSYEGEENIEGFKLLEQLAEWIEKQNKEKSFPDFGNDCTIESIYAVQSIPASLRMQNISKYLSQYRISYEKTN